MNCLTLIKVATWVGCCLTFLSLNTGPSIAQASNKASSSMAQKNTQQKNTPTSEKGMAKDLEKTQGVSLPTTQQFIVQQSTNELTPSQSQPDPQILAQTEPQLPSPEQVIPDPETVEPGRRTRSGASYVGVGANVGGFGVTSVGSLGLIVYSKVGLSRYFSVRPAVVTDFADDATFILPATFDFAPIPITDSVAIAPYIGGGATVSTRGNVRPLLTGGLDVPISQRFTATFGINTSFGDDVDLGGFVGLGYNFR
jgi:hypothetical protein